MNVLIPLRMENPKTGLSDLLSLSERREFNLLMLENIVNVASRIGDVYIISPDFKGNIPGAKIFRSKLKLNPALNQAINSLGLPSIIIPSDVPLIRERHLKTLMKYNEDIIISPGNRCGTNAMVLRKKIKLRYNGKSFKKHLEEIQQKGLSYRIVQIKDIKRDIDDESDLKELHKVENNLSEWLEDKISRAFLKDST